MKYAKSFVAWTPNTDQIKVGPLLHKDDIDWSRQYRYTGGGAITRVRTAPATERDLMMMIEFNTIVVRDQVPVQAVHNAFLAIDEYRRRISPDIAGADPEWAD